MKICLISSLYPPYSLGGVGINVHKLAVALRKKGHQVVVITTKDFSGLRSLRYEISDEAGIKVYRFFPLNLYHPYVVTTEKKRVPVFLKILWHIIDTFNVHSFVMVYRIVRKEKPDVIHSTYLPGLSSSVFTAAASLHVPLIHTLRGFHLLCPCANFICPYTQLDICNLRPFPCRTYSFLKKIIIDSIPRVIISPSQFVLDVHKRYRFFKKSMFNVVPNFIDNDRDYIRRPDDKKGMNIFCVGRLSHEKGVHVLISAIKEISDGSIRLHIIGDGPQRHFLEDLGKTDERIVFHGHIPATQMADFYTQGDILVVPSVCYDNFPTVILEAFSYGIPVIGSETGGIPELIKDGYNGFLFKAGDKEALKEKINVCITDYISGRVQWNRMSLQAFQTVKKYKSKEIIGELEEIYTTVSSKKMYNMSSN